MRIAGKINLKSHCYKLIYIQNIDTAYTILYSQVE